MSTTTTKTALSNLKRGAHTSVIKLLYRLSLEKVGENSYTILTYFLSSTMNRKFYTFIFGREYVIVKKKQLNVEKMNIKQLEERTA